MTDQTQFLMNQAILAIKAGDLAGGRKLLESVLEADSNNESAWLWMSAAVSSDAERRHCLEQVLVINPDNAQAKRGLEKLPPPPQAEPQASPFENLEDEFAVFDLDDKASDQETASTPPFTWALEPEQRDLAPDRSTEEVDLEALFKSFDRAAETKQSASQSLDWGFEEPLPATSEAEQLVSAPEDFSSEESLNRFLGIEPPKEELRGFYEEDARQGKPVPAFTFGEELEEVMDSSSDAFVSPPLSDTDFSFDVDKITAETLSAPAETYALPQSPTATAGEQLEIWTNPGGMRNNLMILREQYLILANPDPLFIQNIREEVARGEVKKKSLGRTAKAIELKSLLRVEGEPEATNFRVTYLKGKQKLEENVDFASSSERNEAMDVLLSRLGLGYQKVEEHTQRAKLLLGPLAVLILSLIGAPLLIFLSMRLLGAPAGLDDLTLRLIVPVVIGLIGLVGLAAGLVWLLRNLRQPEHLVAIVPAAGMEL